MTKPFVPIIFSFVYIAAGYLTYQNIYSILPVFANIIFISSMWLDNEKTIKILGIPVGILWMIYNIVFFSLFGFLSQLAVVVTLILYLLFVDKYEDFSDKITLKIKSIFGKTK